MQVGGIVVCGGEGQRVGQPKAWLRIGDETFLQRAVRILRSVAAPVVAAGRVGQALPTLPDDVEIVGDVVERSGPLAGLAAGFKALHERCEAAIVVTCDHPLLKPEFLRRLVELLGDDSGVIPEHGGQSYPLLAIYRIDTRGLLDEMLADRELSVRRFAARCAAREIPADQWRDVDARLDSLLNVNDRATYERVLRDHVQ